MTNYLLEANGVTVEQRVFVVDDDPAVLSKVRGLCTSVGLPVETYPTAHAFLAAYDIRHGGCLVLDVRLPGMSGLELQRELLTRGIGLPVIMMTGHPDVAIAVCALQAGALDFFVKPFSEQGMLDRIGGALTRDRESRLVRARRAAVATRLGTLSAREREVLYMVVAGKANKVVAIDLGISVKTVEVHRARVMQKMAVDSLADLVRVTLFLHSEDGAGRGAAVPPAPQLALHAAVPAAVPSSRPDLPHQPLRMGTVSRLRAR